MIHLPIHAGPHAGPAVRAAIPVRPTAAIAVGVLLINIALLWLAFGLRSAPASDAEQIEELIHRQIAALNERDAAALQVTYCAGTGPVGAMIVDTLGPASAGPSVAVARITDIQFIGSSPAELASARITLTLSGPENRALSAQPATISYFEHEETGWKMCQPDDRSQTDRYL